jgi:imidazolonepropionase-like amidohydrolase
MEGRIAPGALADLVLLDGNPLDDIAHLSRVEAVFQRGRQWTRADLDSLLRAARRTAARQ